MESSIQDQVNQEHDTKLNEIFNIGLGLNHYSLSRSKYFHLLLAPIEGFITLIE